MQVPSSSLQCWVSADMSRDIYWKNCTLEFCRDIVMRTHGKFSMGSENKFHRFAIEIMPCVSGYDIRVWELTHKGCTFDFLSDDTLSGTRMRTVVNLKELAEMDNPPKFAIHLLDFLEELNVSSYHPKYIYMWCKLDFEGKIWNTPKVYVRDINLSSVSLSERCSDEAKEYVKGVFHYYRFKEFSRMRG